MTTTPQESRSTITQRLNRARTTRRDANELIGLCHGVLADGSINVLEAQFIQRWLRQKQDLLDSWPWNVLYDRLSDMLKDGALDSEEERELLGILSSIAPPAGDASEPAHPPREYGDTKTSQSPQTFCIPGKTFVLTGEFALGTREQCTKATELLGGKVLKAVSKKVDYLIVGEMGSADWATSSWGRKIEHAKMLAAEGHPIQIISEQLWAEHL